MTLSRRNPHQSGLMLVECLVYIAGFFLITGLAFAAYYRSLDNSRGLRHNADDIVRALKAGERWRADVRSARGPLALEQIDDEQALRIPQASGEIVYLFSQGAVWRKTPAEPVPVISLDGVKGSRMLMEARGEVTAWRWELELRTRQKVVRLRPLFTFIAAAAQGNP
jgi:hypothetical protein